MTTPSTTSPPPSTPTASGPTLTAGTVLGGRFKIVDFQRRTPYAELYRATDQSDGKTVTLKLLHPDLLADALVRARLEQQVAIAAQLEHKNLAQTWGFFTDGPHAFIAAEHVEGTSLRDMLTKKLTSGRGFSLKGAYNVLAHVCNGLIHAHGALAHGALTLDAVMVNAAGRVKLTDFGLSGLLSRLNDQQIEEAGATWATVAPEVWAQPDQVDKRADVYSAGAMLVELLVGQPVQAGGPALSQLVPGLPPELDEVVARCLKTSPEERYADAQELRGALHASVEKHIPTATSGERSISGVMPAVHNSGQMPAAHNSGQMPVAQSSGQMPVARASGQMPVAAGAKPAAGPPPPPPARPSAPPLPAGPSRPPVPGAAAGPGPASRPPAGAAPGPGAAAKKPSAPARYTSHLINVEDHAERWLIQKDKLDFGPYRLAEVKLQIENGQIVGDHTIVDMENGEKRRVREHPLLRDIVRLAEGHLDEKRQLEADAIAAHKRRNRLLAVLSVLGVLIVLGGGGLAYYLLTMKPKEKIVYKERDGDEKIVFEVAPIKVEPPAPKTKKHGKKGMKNAAGEFDSATTLGNAEDEGGDEQLSQDVVQRVMTSNFGVLKGCVLEERRRNPTLRSVDMEFIIKGTGQVSAVKTNGTASSPLSSCMFAKMQGISFPKFNGSRTQASFSLALK